MTSRGTTCVCMYIHIYVHICVCPHIGMRMFVCIYRHVCVSVCMHEYVYGYANVRRWVMTGDEAQGKRGARSRQRRDASHRLPRFCSAGWLLLSGGDDCVCTYVQRMYRFFWYGYLCWQQKCEMVAMLPLALPAQ